MREIMSDIYEYAKKTPRFFEKEEKFNLTCSQYDMETNKIKKPKKNYTGTTLDELGGVPISWDGEAEAVFCECSDAHTLIVGPTAAKKSRLVTMPTVRILGAAKESMIICDPKAEIYNRTASQLKESGYDIYVLNLRDPTQGIGWNPLEIPFAFYKSGELDLAHEFVEDIAQNLIQMSQSKKDPFWDNSAGSFFFGLVILLFQYAKEFSLSDNVINLESILTLRNYLCEKKQMSIKQNVLWQYARQNPYLESALIGTIETADSTREGILSVFDQKMRLFSTRPNLARLLSSNEISFNSFEEKPSALYIILPDEKTSYHGIVSLFIKQSYEYIIHKVQKDNGDAKLKRRLNYVLDEFSSLPTISDFPAMITAARSRNIRFHIVIQSKHQLLLRYHDETSTILANCSNWIFLTSRELEFLKEISELCGMVEKKGSMQPLLTISSLQRLDKMRGEALILCGRQKPYITCLPDIKLYDHNSFSQLKMKKRSEYKHPALEIDENKIVKLFPKLKQNHNQNDFLRSSDLSLDEINANIERIKQAREFQMPLPDELLFEDVLGGEVLDAPKKKRSGYHQKEVPEDLGTVQKKDSTKSEDTVRKNEHSLDTLLKMIKDA